MLPHEENQPDLSRLPIEIKLHSLSFFHHRSELLPVKACNHELYQLANELINKFHNEKNPNMVTFFGVGTFIEIGNVEAETGFDPVATTMYPSIPANQILKAFPDKTIKLFDSEERAIAYAATKRKVCFGWSVLNLPIMQPGIYRVLYDLTGKSADNIKFELCKIPDPDHGGVVKNTIIPYLEVPTIDVIPKEGFVKYEQSDTGLVTAGRVQFPPTTLTLQNEPKRSRCAIQ